MNAEIVNFLLQAYPVGAIYINCCHPPSELFGGTWETIGGRFLIGADSTYTIGSTGGESVHMLIVNEMPSHIHAIAYSATGEPITGGNAQFSVNQPVITKLTKSTDYGAYYGSVTNSMGSGQPHNNMPPYLAVYMWKRIK